MDGLDLDALRPLLWTGGAVLLLGFLLLRLRGEQRRWPASALPPFLRHFEAQGIPAEVSASVFRQLQRWMEAQDGRFAVRPDQDLASVYGLVPEELHAALSRLAPECGRRFDPQQSHVPLVTVADLVTALSRCPETQA